MHHWHAQVQLAFDVFLYLMGLPNFSEGCHRVHPIPIGLRSRGTEGSIRHQRVGLGSLAGSSWEIVAHNLEGLTEGILNYMEIEEVPIEYQIHMVGVIPRVHRLLR